MLTQDVYIGRPCCRCGSKVRTVRNDICIPCSKGQAVNVVDEVGAELFTGMPLGQYKGPGRRHQEASSRSRASAKTNGRKKYTGRACKKCGHAVRYVSNNCCVTCSAEASQKQIEARKRKVSQEHE